MLCKNISQTVARFEIAHGPGRSTKYEVQPGQEVDVEDGYCQEYINGSRRVAKPIISQLCPQMKPTGKLAPGVLAQPGVVGHNDGGQLQRMLEQQAAVIAQQTALMQQMSQQLAALQAGKPVAVEAAPLPPPPAVATPEPTEPTEPTSSEDDVDLGAADGEPESDAEAARATYQTYPLPELLQMAQARGVQLSKADKKNKNKVVDALMAQ